MSFVSRIANTYFKYRESKGCIVNACKDQKAQIFSFAKTKSRKKHPASLRMNYKPDNILYLISIFIHATVC